MITAFDRREVIALNALFKYATAVLAVWMVGGCATYEEPTTGPTAIVQIGGRVDFVAVGVDGRCGSTKAVDTRQTPSFRVRAEQELLVRFNRHGGYSSPCVGDVFFTPRGGRRYLLIALAAELGCKIRLATSADGQRWAEDTAYRSEPPRNCLLGS